MIPLFIAMQSQQPSNASQATAPQPQTPQQSPMPDGREIKVRHVIVDIVHGIVLLLSLLLIVYMSYDTFMNIPFLQNHHYMTFQFWVCLFFLFDFFFELVFAADKKQYLKRRWFFFLISIPYLNIIHLTNITFSEHVLYYIRFIPLIRGGYALAVVIGSFSSNKAVSLLYQYLALLITLVYLLSLLFYYEEHVINPDVNTYWDALYWSCMNLTTVGCPFGAVTPVGKVIAVILPTCGMLILPLFTVYITSMVRRRDKQKRIY